MRYDEVMMMRNGMLGKHNLAFHWNLMNDLTLVGGYVKT